MKKNKDCTECKFYDGFITKNYFKCKVFKCDEFPNNIDIYDREYLKKGTCDNFVPIGVNLDDNLHDNDVVDRYIKKNDQAVPRQE